MPTDPATLLTAADLLAARRRSDWPEAVLFTSTRPPAGDVTVAVYADGVYPVALREAARSNGAYRSGDVRATLPDPLPGGAGPPKPGDVLAYRGAAYTVLDVAGSPWWPDGPFSTVTARNPSISYALRETLTVLRFTPSPGAGGLRTGGEPAAVWAGDGKLQVIDAAGTEAAGLHATRTTAEAHLAGAVRLRAGDVIAQADGTRWEFDGQADLEALGLLTTVRCHRIG